MRLLLDTCVVSELRHPNGAQQVKDFLRAAVETDLFISVITLGELARGISLLDEGARKTALAEWLQTLESRFSDRILPIDRKQAGFGERSRRAASGQDGHSRRLMA